MSRPLPYNLASQPALASLALAYIDEGIDQHQLVSTCQQLKASFEIACDTANKGERSIIRTTTKAHESASWTVCPADHGSGDVLIVNSAAVSLVPVGRTWTRGGVDNTSLIPMPQCGLTALEEARAEVQRCARMSLALENIRWQGPIQFVNGAPIARVTITEVPRVTQADLGALENVVATLSSFGVGCENLRGIQVPSSICTIHYHFLSPPCCAVASLDLSHCDCLAVVWGWFGYENTALQSVSLPRNITSLGFRFLQGSGVADIDLSHCSSLVSIARWFAAETRALLRVALPASVTKIGGQLLRGSSVAVVDLSRCEALAEVDHDGFCKDCESLRRVRLPSSGASALPPAFVTQWLAPADDERSYCNAM